jgi:hypothetical protein
MLIAALHAERDEYVESLKHFRDERGHARVVKNGHARPREIQIRVHGTYRGVDVRKVRLSV